jgi:hypothetical protein
MGLSGWREGGVDPHVELLGTEREPHPSARSQGGRFQDFSETKKVAEIRSSGGLRVRGSGQLSMIYAKDGHGSV